MATQNQMSDDEAAFAAAFNEGDEPASDEGLGMTPPGEDAPAAEDGATGGEPAAVVLAVADADEIKEEGQEQMAEATADEASAQPGEEDEGPIDPKEEQRRKSWEGRLRAREEELARREAELKKPGEGEEPEGGDADKGAAIEQAAEELEAKGDSEGAEAVEDVAEKVESGELSAEQAMKILAEDFGPDFVKMIEVIAASKAESAGRSIAEKATGELGKSVQEIIDSITDDRARNHFEAISDKHPDFNDVASTPEFAEFAKGYPNGEQITSSGSAKQIVKMLDAFKASSNKAPVESDPAVDAAEGVRSKGLRLPDAPTKADGYEDAWSQF